MVLFKTIEQGNRNMEIITIIQINGNGKTFQNEEI